MGAVLATPEPTDEQLLLPPEVQLMTESEGWSSSGLPEERLTTQPVATICPLGQCPPAPAGTPTSGQLPMELPRKSALTSRLRLKAQGLLAAFKASSPLPPARLPCGGLLSSILPAFVPAADSGGGLPLLGPPRPADTGKLTVVLDLDETLVHAAFHPVPNADFTVRVQVEEGYFDLHVLKRPWLDYFLAQVSEHFETVVFTASMPDYADSVLDACDPHSCISWRLYRDACTVVSGLYVKDLSRLGRPLERTVLVDNSWHSSLLQPSSAVPSATFTDDISDAGLLDILNVLMEMKDQADVRTRLPAVCTQANCRYTTSDL